MCVLTSREHASVLGQTPDHSRRGQAVSSVERVSSGDSCGRFRKCEQSGPGYRLHGR